MGLSNYAEDLLLTYLLTGSSVTRPATPWTIALHFGDPGVDGLVDEVTTTEDVDYVRKTITFADPVADSGQSLSSNAPAWTVGTGTGYTLTHISIWENGGECVYIGALLVSKPLVATNVHTFNIGDVVAILRGATTI